MNEDYLWDRTGEPDAEVQELEDVLGTLRYQPRPLVLPADLQTASRRRFFPAFAIAATILLALLAGGLWLSLRRQQISGPREVVQVPQRSNDGGTTPIPKTAAGGDRQKATAPSVDKPRDVVATLNPALHKNRGARKGTSSNTPPQVDEMTAAQRAEGEAAKEQLMMALRVVSSKLNLAQRKTQSAPATNSIRNQHKLG